MNNNRSKLLQLLILLIGILLVIVIYGVNFRFDNDIFTSPDENIILSLANNISEGEYSLGTNPDFKLRGTQYLEGKIVSGKFYGFSLFLSIYSKIISYKIIYLLLIVLNFLSIFIFFRLLTEKPIIGIIIVLSLIVFPIIFLTYTKGIMEHPLPVLLIFSGLILIERKKILFGYLMLSMTCFYRPDYLLLFIIVFIYDVINHILSRDKEFIKTFLIRGVISITGILPLFLYNRVFYGDYLKMGPSVLYTKTSESSFIPIATNNNIFINFFDNLIGSISLIPHIYLGILISIAALFRIKNAILKKYSIIFNISLILFITYLFISGARLNGSFENSIYRYLLPYEIFYYGVFIYLIFEIKTLKIYKIIIYLLIIISFIFSSTNIYKKNFDLRLYYDSLLNTIKSVDSSKQKLIITDNLDKIYNLYYKVILLGSDSNYSEKIKEYFTKYSNEYEIYLSFGNSVDIGRLDGIELQKIESPTFIKIYKLIQ